MDQQKKNSAKIDLNQPSNINFRAVPEDLKSEKQRDIQLEKIQTRLRDNKYVFYGLPISIIVLIFIALLGFVAPAYEKYTKYAEKSKNLDANIVNANKSASNLNTALAQETVIDSYNSSLQKDIPENSELSILITTVQKNANDFGLKWSFTAGNSQSSGNTTSSIGGVAQNPSQSLFQSLTTGEVDFTPKFLGENAKAKLLSIEISMQGNKEDFFKFINTINSLQPKVILSSINYKETVSPANPQVITVDVNLRLESYSLKLTQNDPKAPVPVDSTSETLEQLLSEEQFIINSEISENLSN